MDAFEALQQRLAAVTAVNHHGSEQPHVVVGLPSYSMGVTILLHYRTRLAPMEHRYLLPGLSLGRIAAAELVLVTCGPVDEEVLDYYARLADPADPASVRRRLHVLVVPDDTPRGISAKLLDRPDLIAGLRELIGDRPAVIEPWNVTEDEVAVALALGVPIFGTAPSLWPLGFKSAGRRMFRDAGVPVPEGCEGVHDAEEVAAAIAAIRRRRPQVRSVVVKQDNSGAGDGNFVVHLQRDGHRIPLSGLRANCLSAAPEWFAHDLAEGGVVEELVAGSSVTSPSAQVNITADGEVQVLSTHEQMLGGDNGQVYVGCSFPADPAYAAALARHARAVSERLAAAGARGRLAVDFMAARSRGRWAVFALEVNLRKGGTTHPFSVLRHLVPGTYDEARGCWVSEDGSPRSYRSTDALLDPSWVGLEPAQAFRAVADAGLAFDHTTRTGVVLHMLSCLAVDGRLGYTSIGHNLDEANALAAATEQAIAKAAQLALI
jgi:hypothetical protein